ncbi:hypothetical protein F1714_12105, partial [Streptococcus pneumoniae]
RLNGLRAQGYEIHHGQGIPLVHQEGPLLATWLHGLLENPGVQRALFGQEAKALEVERPEGPGLRDPPRPGDPLGAPGGAPSRHLAS